jgi:hypothetical protein
MLALGLVNLPQAHAAAPTQKLTFAQLALTPLDPDPATWPETLRSLADHQVRLTGYLLPLVTESGLTREFLLLRNQNACCYGRMPAANEYVVVHAPAPGVAVTMDVPVTVRGTLRLSPLGAPGPLTRLFVLEDAARL